MSSTSTNSRRTVRVEATGEVGAAARDTYRMIADYRTGHTRVIPQKYFRNLCVERGGYGSGTIINYDLIMFGKTNHGRAEVTEPDPGRVLMETDAGQNIVTTFTVDEVDASRSRVTIATELPTRGGIAGSIERFVIRSFLRRVYADELAQLDREVRIG